MSNFVRNVKQHKVAALVCFLILAAVIAVTVLLMRNEKEQTDLSAPDTEQQEAKDTVTEYFTDTDYPVKVTKGGGKLTLALDGAKSPDTAWQTVSDDTEQAVIKAENDGEEKDGILSSVVTPVSVGYAKLTYSKSGELGGIAYNAVTIEAEIYVSVDDENNMSVTLSDIKQSSPQAGALDTDTPYLIDGNRVVMPNGGDWIIVVSLAKGAPANLYIISRNTGDDGVEYLSVEKNPTAVQGTSLDEIAKIIDDSKIVLVSSSLGIQQPLKCELSSEKTWVLSVSDEEVELPDLSAFDSTDSGSDADSSTESEESSSDE